MDWIAFTGVATAFTGIVILVTVFTGFRQLRHLQHATQLDGMLKLIEDLYSPKLLQSIEYVRFKLPEQLEDEAVLAQLTSMHAQQDHPAYVVLRWLEKIGTLARYGLIDPEPLFALNSPDYQHMWAVLRRILINRRPSSGGIVPFDNAEYLCLSAWRWLRQTYGRATYEQLAEKYGWDPALV